MCVCVCVCVMCVPVCVCVCVCVCVITCYFLDPLVIFVHGKRERVRMRNGEMGGENNYVIAKSY